MRLLTEDAKLSCKHRGSVENAPSQSWVTIAGRRVLVDSDPEGRSIKRCPNYGISIFPCKTTLRVQSGYSTFLRVDGHRICLDTVTGLTDGTPPGVVRYTVDSPGQAFVSAGA